MILNNKQNPLLILILCLSISLASSYRLAKDGCSDLCGNVSIPYPFGMNSRSCYHDEWFEITCNKSSTNSAKSVPFLRKVNLEVLNISINEGIVTVNNPIVSSCLNPDLEIDFSESTFTYTSRNRFMAVGCDNLAVLTNRSGENLSGCYSACANSSGDAKGCFGINCCHTTVPSSLSLYKVNISSYGVQNSSESCKYAFLVSEDWLADDSLSSSAAISIVNSRRYVPSELSWWMKFDNGMSLRNFKCPDVVAFSGYYFINASYEFYRCQCPYQYVGNPYVEDGCHGFDECSNGTCNGHCKAEPGGYVCHPRNVKDIVIGVTTSFGSIFLLVGSFALYKAIVKRRNRRLKQKFFKRNGGLLLQQQMSPQDGKVEKTKIFTSEELEKATDHFNANRVLGRGGQGTVYKGMLTDGKIVAIKKSLIMDECQVEQFINEVVILSQINHRNVVHLFGCCLETEVPLLVYEFIPNGTLFDHIHNQTDEFPMLWETRLRIATEIANSLAYLHSSTFAPIYHRDIKSTNILLDDKYRAKVSDFGTSKSIPMEQTHLTTLVQGTFGYLDPEYFQTSQFTDKSDVYSFGVVLVELLTGQKPITWTKSQEERSLATFFLIAIDEKRLFDIIDPQLLKEKKNKKQIVVVADLAKLCLNLSGKKRPAMKEIAMELERIQTSTSIHETIQQDTHGAVENIDPLGASTSSEYSMTVFSDYSLVSSLDVEPLLSHTT